MADWRRGIRLAAALATCALALVTIGALAPTASATVQTVTAVDDTGAPTDSYAFTDGVYAKVPTTISGGYVCAVAPGGSTCSAKAIPIPPLNSDPSVPLYKPRELPVGRYELVGFDSDGEPITARSADFGVTSEQCTDETDTWCSAKLDVFKTSANAVHSAAIVFRGLRYLATFGGGGLAGVCTAFGTAGGLFSLGGLAAGGIAFFAVGVVGVGVFAHVLGVGKGATIADEAVTHFGQLKADPPDPNFQTVAPPEFSDAPRPTDPDDLTVFDAHDRMSAFSGALLTAMERFQGAEIAGDDEKALMQLQAMSEFNAEMTAAAVDVVAADRAFADRIAADPDLDFTVAQDQLDSAQAVVDRVASSGLTPDEEDQLVDLGLSAAERDEVVADIGDLTSEGVKVGRSFSDHVEESAALTESGIAGFEDFGAELERMIEERTGGNTLPTAAFTATPTAGDAPLDVSFDATASSDFDGGIGSYEWDFGDGGTGSGATVSHVYTSPGSYTATLTVTDDDGAAAEATRTIVVEAPNAPPTASFTATPDSGQVPLDVNFDASASSDGDGGIVSYAWTFGDGGEATGPAPSHRYTAAGIYVVTLTLTDDDGATAQSTLTVTATDPENVAPTASFTAEPASGTVPLLVAFDASTSDDPDGDVESYAWDFGDGASGSGAVAGHTYTAAGVYQATLTVTDDDGAVGTAVQTVVVNEPDNLPPTATLTASPTSGVAPLAVDFVSSVADSDGDVAWSYLDFGDGQGSSEPSVTHTYSGAGAYTATLTVYDNDGAAAVATKAITVEPANVAPTAAFTATPEQGLAPLPVAFDATGSSDSDGSVATYAWQFGDGATASGVTAAHTFSDPGTYEVKLTVTDDEGATGEVVKTVKATPANRPPNPQDDTLAAEGAGALDVLLNDADPDDDALTVVATGAPEHGTAKCAALGGCLYTAPAGYEGGDAFTYRVRDTAGHEAAATVTVQVGSAPAETTVRLRADAVSTRAGAAVTLKVLANDTGSGLTVTEWSDPGHGSVDCAEDGTCEYEPDAGFSGSDGFTYTARDESGAAGSADVRLTVAPASAGYGVTVGGAPAPVKRASVTQGRDARWSTAVAPSPAGIGEDALAALPRPAVTAELDGAHSARPASVRTARGWTADPVAAGGRAIRARAGADALLGDVSDAIPRPLPAINQGTGGDGHVPILVGSKVFAFFHHSAPTSVTCVDRATGSLCPGYPKVTNQGTTSINGPGVVVGSRIYTHLVPAGQGAQSVGQSLFCWDTATDRPCGLIVVDRLPSGVPGGSAPVLVGGRMYFAGDGGRLFCVDPATGASCTIPSLPTGLAPGSGGEYDIVSHGTRVFVSRLGDKVACLDVAAGGPCPGWSLPQGAAGWNLVNRYSPAGVADGVCVLMYTTATCVRDADPSAGTVIEGWPATEGYYSVTLEAETGTRTLLPSHGTPGMACWDWITMAPCTGGDYVDGWISADANGTALPIAYGAAWDGSCAIGLGDPGLVFTVDPSGKAPCTSLGSGTEPRSIDLRDQRCDGTIGSASWKDVALADSAAGELASVTVTVRDGKTGAPLAIKDITAGKLDLSGIDPDDHPEITVEANAISTSGDPAWADAIPPRIRVGWNSDPKQLCFDTRTEPDCVSPLGPIGIRAGLDGSAVKDEETLDLLRAACPPQLGDLPDRSVAEQTALDASASASDPNPGPLTYTLVKAPPGMTIDAAGGRIAWTPGEAQGPGTYDVTVKVIDGGGLSDQGSFKVTATEVNRPPALSAPGDAVVRTGGPLTVKVTASDPDLPANRLAFSLPGAPAGAGIDPVTGALSWAAVPSGTHPLTVRVTDDGAPALSADGRFAVTGRDAGGTLGETDAGTAADLVRACTSRGIVLEDVFPSGNRVRLVGVAEKAFAGRRVELVFSATGRVVARAVVRPDGSFAASAPLPPRRLRASNRARYEARIGAERSLKLKLVRRMLVTSLRAGGGKVTIAGRVVGPLARRAKDRQIVLERRVTCTRLVTVRRFRPRANGSFKITVAVPAGEAAAVYRLRTKVRKSTRGSQLASTFTLPRAVDFRK